jgi:hypothetical protein
MIATKYPSLLLSLRGCFRVRAEVGISGRFAQCTKGHLRTPPVLQQIVTCNVQEHQNHDTNGFSEHNFIHIVA